MSVVFVLALIGMTLISGVSLFGFMAGRVADRILTGGATPPYSINLRVGLAESLFGVQASIWSPCSAPFILCAKVLGDADLPDHGHGHPGHGDDSRSCSICSCFSRSSRLPPTGCFSLQNTPAALSATFKYLDGRSDSLDVFPARHECCSTP